MIKKLSIGDVAAIATLHEISFPNDTLTLFGQKFLQLVYRELLCLPDSYAFGYFKNHEFGGFILGVGNSQTYLKRVIGKKWFFFILVLGPQLFRPQILKRIWETFFYGRQSNASGAELLSIAISTKFRNKGVGTKLFNKLKRSFKKTGIQRFHVSVYADNRIANRFYAKMAGSKIRSFYLYDKQWHVYDFLESKISFLTVVLPTYNEIDNIIPLIKEILKVCRDKGITPEVLVVDDNSPDKTATRVRSTFRLNQKIRVCVRIRNRGLARAIAYGIRQARYPLVVVMDTDFNHNPRQIPQLIEGLSEADIVIGSRFVGNGGMEDRPRYYLSFVFNLFIRWYLGLSTTDNLSGFFAAPKKLLIPYLKPDVFSGFGEYFIRLLYLLHLQRKTFVEVPVFYILRRHGHRKSRFLHMFFTYSKAVIRLKKESIF